VKIVVFMTEFGIQRIQFFIGGLKLLFRRLQLLVGALQLFVG
jgi:hypothetical protein